MKKEAGSMKYIKVLGLSLMMLLGFKLASDAQVIVPTGTTTRQASQLIFWYDQTFTDFGRFSFIQVTNAGNVGVDIHVQIFKSDDSATCVEFDFDDVLTANDTHIYDLFGIIKNKDGSLVPHNFIDTKGFVVITPINSDF